jgi:hypothetical protein
MFFREVAFRPLAGLTIAPGTRLTEVSGALDVAVGDTDPEPAPLGAETRADAAALRAAHGGELVATVGASGLADAADRLRDSANVVLDGVQSTGAYGSPEDPTIVRLAGHDVDGVLTVGGILLADAPLRVRGRIEVEGLLLAPQGLDVEGELVVRGAAWVAGALRVASGAAVRVAYEVAALDVAGAVGGAVLPRNAVLGAWREIW